MASQACEIEGILDGCRVRGEGNEELAYTPFFLFLRLISAKKGGTTEGGMAGNGKTQECGKWIQVSAALYR